MEARYHLHVDPAHRAAALELVARVRADAASSRRPRGGMRSPTAEITIEQREMQLRGTIGTGDGRRDLVLRCRVDPCGRIGADPVSAGLLAWSEALTRGREAEPGGHAASVARERILLVRAAATRAFPKGWLSATMHFGTATETPCVSVRVTGNLWIDFRADPERGSDRPISRQLAAVLTDTNSMHVVTLRSGRKGVVLRMGAASSVTIRPDTDPVELLRMHEASAWGPPLQA